VVNKAERRGLALVPRFEYLPGLALPDLARARLALSAARAAAERGDFPCDLGGAGRTADETAERLSSAGEVLVVAGAGDEVARALLVAALERRGVAVALGAPPAAAPGAPAGAATGASAGAAPSAREELFLVAERGELSGPGAQLGALFERTDERTLQRRGAGRAAGVAPEIERIALVSGLAEARALAGEAGLLAALRVPRRLERARLDELVAAASELAARLGAERVRLAFEPRAGEPGRLGGAAWAARYGLEDARLRADLVELVDRALPQHLGLVHTALGYWEIGVDPLEEMYAGNALPDRNAELLANIV